MTARTISADDLETLARAAHAACRDLGLSPWLVLHRPRLYARIAAQDALMAQVRADAMRVQGKRPRGRDGRFVGRAG